MNWIKMMANDLEKKYQTTDPFELASLLKIELVPWNLHEEINGFYKYDKRNKYIVYNKNLPQKMQRFVCAHELGHAVLHPRSNTPFLRKNTLFSIDKIEVEANTFAVELLLPERSISEYLNTNLSIYQICEMHGIPRELSHLKNFSLNL